MDQEEMDNKIDEWHKGGSGIPLHEFLGLTLEEYKNWIEKGILPDTECPGGCICRDTRTCEDFWDCVSININNRKKEEKDESKKWICEQ